MWTQWPPLHPMAGRREDWLAKGLGETVVGAQTPQSDWESSLATRSPSQPLTLKDLLPLCGPYFPPPQGGLGD